MIVASPWYLHLYFNTIEFSFLYFNFINVCITINSQSNVFFCVCILRGGLRGWGRVVGAGAIDS